jgi:uncharacterized protein (DUF39 family)
MQTDTRVHFIMHSFKALLAEVSLIICRDLNPLLHEPRNRVSSVGTVAAYRLDDRGIGF